MKKDSNYTIKNYKNDLLELYDFTNDLLNIDRITVSNYLEYLYSRKLDRNSISRKLSAIRSFYNYLVKQDKLTNNYFNEVSNPKRKKGLPKYVKNNDLEKMFESFDLTKPLDTRNRLILELLYATGIRVSEAVNIKLNDIDYDNDTIKILGKGNKERLVIYGSFASEILNIYLNESRPILDKKNSEYLFLNKLGAKLSDRSVRNIINDTVRRCEIDYHITPHTLRHTFATDMIAAGADLVSVKEMLGHSSLNTTSIYTHLTNEQIKNVYNQAHPRAEKEK